MKYILIIFLLLCIPARAHEIDIKIIEQIESAGDPLAFNAKTGARGSYQFMKIAWEDVQSQNKELIKYDYAPYSFHPEVSKIFATKYFAMLEKYLKHYNIPVNTDTMIASWNWGIGNVNKWWKAGGNFDRLPKETRDFIKKYKEESHEE